MATSKIPFNGTRINNNLQGVDLNTLPDVFGTYGFWGGSNVSNYPSGVDPSGCLLITVPCKGAPIQYQMFITQAHKIYTRRKTYQNVWDTWGTLS